MNMNKILFLIQLPPPVHGASIVNHTIQNSLEINKNIDAHYLNISPAKGMTDIGRFSAQKLFLTIGITIKAIRSFLSLRPDLVYITLSPHGLALYKDGLLALFLKLLGAQVVFHLHGKGVEKNANASRVKREVYKRIFKNVDIIHLSERLFFDVESVRDKNKVLLAVPNSVPSCPAFLTNTSDQKIRFIFLSNFMPSKGADTLIRAAYLFPEELQTKFTLTLIGSPNDKAHYAEIKKLVADSISGNIKLLDAKYGADKYEYLQNSDIFVLPTKNDCYPLSILEAMSAGLAVISTNEGAIADIVEPGVTGELLENCTPESLAEVMLRFIENPGHAKACGAAGLAKYNANYTTDRFEENLLAALNKIASNTQKKGFDKTQRGNQ